MSTPFRHKGLIGEIMRWFVRVKRFLIIKIFLGHKFSVGKNFSIGKSADVRPCDYFKAGNRVGVGKNFTVECNVIIGDDVLISSNVAFVGNDHRFSDPGKTIFTEGRFPPAEVILEGDNLIGYGVIVVAPAKISKGCIVGAGAVVVGDLPAYSICVGVPARPISNRF